MRRLLDGERLAPAIPRGSRTLRLAVRPSFGIPMQLAALGTEAVRLTGELADAWYPFLMPVSGLGDGIGLLEEGVARGLPGRPVPQVRPGVPASRWPGLPIHHVPVSWPPGG